MLFLRASELAARILPALTVLLVIMSTVMVGRDRAERTEIITDAENAASSERVYVARGEGDTTMASSLSELLQQAMFAHGSARRMRMSRAVDSVVRVVSWQTHSGTDGDGG